MFTRLRRRLSREDDGETLLEILIAVVILGVAAVAIMGGMGVSIKVSDIHRKQATAGALVRDYAEAVESWVAAGHYVDCAGASAYAPSAVHFSALPAGYTAQPSPATTYNMATHTWDACGTDPGYQKVELTVSSDDGRANESLDVILRRP